LLLLKQGGENELRNWYVTWSYFSLEYDMQRRRLQVIEVLDEALSLLPKPKYYIPKFEDHYFEHVPNLRREPRVNAQGLKKRRSKPNRQWESWVDVQTFTLQEN
jgi:hypothetical protein